MVWDYRDTPRLRDAVEIVDFDAGWAQAFEQERQRLKTVLGERAVAIEHIGSTAVPGLAAKPVIDILVGIYKYPLVDDSLAWLGTLGYQYRGEDAVGGGQFFRTSPRTRHLRVLAINDPAWRDRLIFRDYLRGHPETADEYCRLKLRLAQEYRLDRQAYTEGKSQFIANVLKRARHGGAPPT